MKLRNHPEHRRGTHGNAMLEFAFAVAVFLPLLLGTFQFGFTFYTYNRLIATIRQGARYASLRTYDSATATPTATYLTAVKNAAVYGNPDGSGTAAVTGLTPAKISVSMTIVNGVPDMVTVALADFTLDAAVTTFHWVNKPAASFRFEGRFAP